MRSRVLIIRLNHWINRRHSRFIAIIGMLFYLTSCNPGPATHDICIEFAAETSYCTATYNWPTVFVASGDSDMNIETIGHDVGETWWGQTYTQYTLYGMNSTTGQVGNIPVVQNASFTLIVQFDENTCIPPTSGCWLWYYQSDYPALEDPVPCSLSSLHSVNFASSQPMTGGCI